MVRLFVALALPDTIRDQLPRICAGLPGARWVPPENLHLTLRFIGELDPNDILDIDDALSHISADAFEIRLDTIGFFGKGRAIRALWIKTARSPELAVLHANVESAMVRAGCAPENRKFLPHVTLARFRRAQSDLVERFVADHLMFKLDPFPVQALTLYSSLLSHAGATYTSEAKYPLGSL